MRQLHSPEGGCAGAGRLVRWPQTKARGVGAVVPGTSLRGEAGRRNTSRGETLWDRGGSEWGWTQPCPSPVTPCPHRERGLTPLLIIKTQARGAWGWRRPQAPIPPPTGAQGQAGQGQGSRSDYLLTNKLTKLTRLPSLLGSFGGRIPAHLEEKKATPEVRDPE